MKRLPVPSTQKCLTYVERSSTLFSAGVDGAIFAWNLDKLFSNEFQEQQQALKQQMKNNEQKGKQEGEGKRSRTVATNSNSIGSADKKEYIMYIAQKTPWFVGDIILCIIDLKNIN